MEHQAVEHQAVEMTNEKLELKMVVYPDKILKQKALAFTEERVLGADRALTRQIAGAMIRNMYEYQGMGLAAQQVGCPFAIFVMDTDWVQWGTKKPCIFLNPVIKEYGEDTIALSPPGEGCLSTPYGYRAQVGRANRVLMEWKDLNWETHEAWFEGTEAICVQHEIDHLHGFLFVDRLSRLKQDIFKRKAKKLRRRIINNQKTMLKEMKYQVGQQKLRENFTKKGESV